MLLLPGQPEFHIVFHRPSLNFTRLIGAAHTQAVSPDDLHMDRIVSLTVTDPRWAKVLLDGHEISFYGLFLGHDLSVSEAATASGQSLNTAYVHVRRLLRLGLLQVSGDTRRAGRMVKTYRLVADQFFVPYAVTAYDTYETFLYHYIDLPSARMLSRSVAQARAGFAPSYGIEITRIGAQLDLRPASAPGEPLNARLPHRPAVYSLALDDLMLNHADAKALQADLRELWQKYRDRDGSRRYVLRLGLAPYPEDR
jgi:hypothetical protein